MDTDKQNFSFLGSGWGFPPRFSKDTRAVVMVNDEEDIRQSLAILLSTSLGERFLQPTYGCDLKKYLFEPLNSGVRALIRDTVETAILYHEPRIKMHNLDLMVSDNDGQVTLEIEYSIRSTNTRHNYVYPFYKDEGSEI